MKLKKNSLIKLLIINYHFDTLYRGSYNEKIEIIELLLLKESIDKALKSIFIYDLNELQRTLRELKISNIFSYIVNFQNQIFTYINTLRTNVQI